MLNITRELVSKIQSNEKELAIMDQEIFEIEKENLKEVIEYAKQGLPFVPIYEDSFEKDGYLFEEEYFVRESGAILKGISVFKIEEFYEETEEVVRELNTELFLLEDGSFKAYHTTYESYYCEDCDSMHCHSHRVISDEQLINRNNIGSVIHNIVNMLKKRASFLEERKNERMSKLENLKMAQ
ncbi:hypothetical protein [Bacillus tuaregi]|uniref:hypothetical protein n=1 Tax=Bacillus tuaregi TaxID=1816695 RepID=UPI0008F83A74|nr:hypothetical protein [Bacillus tuaregi]